MDIELSERINFYRGLLCQYVILSHICPTVFPGVLGFPGTLAVWAFFIISGLLNYVSYKKSTSISTYYLKRFKRLYPLLTLSFIVVAFTQNTIILPDIYTLIPLVINVKANMPYNGPLWTIIIELQLYILTPVFFLIFKYIKKIKLNMLLLMSLYSVVSILISILSSKLITGSVDFSERMVFSAIPYYLFGFVLADTEKTKLNIGNVIIMSMIGSVSFFWVILDRNNILLPLLPTLPTGHLFIEGRMVPYVTTVIILYAINYKNIMRSKIFQIIGIATYEIYLFHGLFAYLLHWHSGAVSNILTITFFYWFMPTLVGVLVCFDIKKMLKIRYSLSTN